MLDPETKVPAALRHERFVAIPLTVDNAALDYDAYVASPDVIRVHSDGRWPIDGFTLEEDRDLVRQHETDHAARRSFAFVLLDPPQREALGCLYLNPLAVEGIAQPAAMVTFWLRQDLQESGLADVVVAAVDEWLVSDWPLASHRFRILPGERSSRVALDRLLRRVDLTVPGEKRPYLWYQTPGRRSDS